MSDVSTTAALLAQTSFGGLDYAVLAVYLVIVVVIGCLVGRGQDNVQDYFLAGRKMSGILVCVSIIATDLSAIGFIGTPGFVFERDLRYHLGSAMMAIPVMVIIATVFVPIYHRLQVFTVYEYLEHRFHKLARPVAAGSKEYKRETRREQRWTDPCFSPHLALWGNHAFRPRTRRQIRERQGVPALMISLTWIQYDDPTIQSVTSLLGTDLVVARQKLDHRELPSLN